MGATNENPRRRETAGLGSPGFARLGVVLAVLAASAAAFTVFPAPATAVLPDGSSCDSANLVIYTATYHNTGSASQQVSFESNAANVSDDGPVTVLGGGSHTFTEHTGLSTAGDPNASFVVVTGTIVTAPPIPMPLLTCQGSTTTVAPTTTTKAPPSTAAPASTAAVSATPKLTG